MSIICLRTESISSTDQSTPNLPQIIQKVENVSALQTYWKWRRWPSYRKEPPLLSLYLSPLSLPVLLINPLVVVSPSHPALCHQTAVVAYLWEVAGCSQQKPLLSPPTFWPPDRGIMSRADPASNTLPWINLFPPPKRPEPSMDARLCFLLTFLLQQVGQKDARARLPGFSLMLSALLRSVKFCVCSSVRQTVRLQSEFICTAVSSATEFGVNSVGFGNTLRSTHFQESLTFQQKRERGHKTD